ncbi:PREDICTED: neuronal acetylcholine receptor subunit alpha-2-like [Nicrophorus vespilloides]|uniref:Neuronal acetylcholine receptor subunit alpha-2-like n=1 Tax=Nicrophorus vespilloides TaxID=110193 RepID=A0ABM1MC59_NICVS|nr:PREDICTED: neuronal acetylcholine receptor subunit alpha-2-like [Nicrophorus vespilloides]
MMAMKILLAVALLCFTHIIAGFTTTKIGPRPLWRATFTDELRQNLLLNYDKFARPAQHFNVTTVQFGVAIRHIDFNELKSTLTVHAWMKLSWNDDKLKWNASDYGNLEVLHLADHEIWQPDLFVYNGAPSTAINHYGNAHALVYSNGHILLVPPVQIVVLCEMNLRYWPFDTQTCNLIFGSWTYNGLQVDLELYENKTVLDNEMLINNSEWKLLRSELQRNVKKYECCTELYPDVTVTLELARISPSYQAIIITPAFAIIFLILMSFWLPPNAGEKIILQSCTAIIITMFLLYFTQKLPAMGTHTPLVVLFFSTSLYVVCFSLMGSIAVIWISRTRHSYGLPWALKQPLIGCLGKWLFLGNYISQSKLNHRVTSEEMRDNQAADAEENNTNDDHQMIGSGSQAPMQQDWVMFAAAIDRLSFIGYSFLFAILAITYSL